MKTIKSLIGILTITLGLILQIQVQGAHFSAVTLPPTTTLVSAAGDTSSNIYVLATFTNTLTIGGGSFISQGGTDYLLAQYGPDGTVRWAISFGSPLDESTCPGASLAVDLNAVWVAGFEPGSMRVVDTAGNIVHTAYSAGNKAGGVDGFLLKFSPAGVALWQASVTGSSASDGGYGLTIDSAGNAYWAGNFNGCCPSPGFATLTAGDGTTSFLDTGSFGTGFLVKFAPAGSLIWVVTAQNQDVSFSNVAVDGSGAVIIAGYSHSGSSGKTTTLTDADGTPWPISNPGYQSSFVAKLDNSGNYQWSVCSAGGPDGVRYLEWRSVTATTNGNVLLVGSYNTTAVSISGADGVVQSLPAPNGQDGFVAALSSSGSVKWLTQIGGSGTDVVNSVSLSSSGGITVAGQMTAGLNLGSTNIDLASLGGSDGFIAMLDPNGNVTDAFALGGPADDDVRFVLAGNSGYDLIAGQQGGDCSAPGIQIAYAGPYVLLGAADYGGPCLPHRATATPQLLNGAVVGVTITDCGCGYTNPPTVLIQGGGGTGATATAVVRNGVVVNITITDPGTGYTNAPSVVIASPPFVPWLEVGLSKVKVTQHVVLGKNYVLESSTDMQTWNQVGPPFTAQAEVIEQEFDIGATGRFFSIRQVQ